MRTIDIQQALRKIGWPVSVDGEFGAQTKAAVWDFQRGWLPPPGRPALVVDGQPGPATRWALGFCLDHNDQCSRFFQFREFASKGNRWIKVHRELVRGLDLYRDIVGPVSIVSGYRDPAHNRRVGGATRSRHLFGDASDIPPKLTVARVRQIGVFTGIGFQGSTGLVRHVDVRPGDPNRPTIWRY